MNCAVVIREDCDKDDDDDNGDNGDPDNATTTMTTPEQIKRKKDKFGELFGVRFWSDINLKEL